MSFLSLHYIKHLTPLIHSPILSVLSPGLGTFLLANKHLSFTSTSVSIFFKYLITPNKLICYIRRSLCTTALQLTFHISYPKSIPYARDCANFSLWVFLVFLFLLDGSLPTIPLNAQYIVRLFLFPGFPTLSRPAFQINLSPFDEASVVLLILSVVSLLPKLSKSTLTEMDFPLACSFLLSNSLWVSLPQQCFVFHIVLSIVVEAAQWTCISLSSSTPY